ncbi:MAG: Rpn family recombination-promoting nuclease/putative transposase [Colwellia sp.]|nr:Rpn family recombination-promoting nuclease/putative transposase [Colwellia sp.]
MSHSNEPDEQYIMKHKINPQVDCVFKQLLGAKESTERLIDFLTSILSPKIPIASVEILNPYNEKEFIGDKLSVVDIKATDNNGVIYQIELQLCSHQFLSPRIIYNWSNIYQGQLKQGESYRKLKPVISIWLIVGKLFKETTNHHHCFTLYDQKNNYPLSDHCAIHVIELAKWHKSGALTHEDSWLYFFKNAKSWNKLPSELNNPIMRSAMNTLKEFSEKEREYHLYEARQEAIRVQMVIESTRIEQEEALARQEEAMARQEEVMVQQEEVMAQQEEAFTQLVEQFKQSKGELEQSEKEIEALKAKLRAAGLH